MAILGIFSRGPDPAFDVVATQRAPRGPRGVKEKPPRIDKPGGANLPAGSAEIVVTVFDVNGITTAQSGWAKRARSFHDSLALPTPMANTDLRGHPRTPEDDARKFAITIADTDQFVVMHRATLKPGGAIQRIFLKAFTLNRGGTTTLPPVPTFDRDVGTVTTVVEIDFADTAPPGLISSPTTPAPDGLILGKKSSRTGSAAQLFDIVIMGDGYAAADMSDFNTHAAKLISDLRGMEPFKSYDANINYHTIRIQSDDSGITDATLGAKATYFHVQTDPDNNGEPEVLGTKYPDLIQNTAAIIAPWSQLDLVIVLVNVDDLVTKPYFSMGSGHAYPDLRVLFASTANPATYNSQKIATLLSQTVGHEAGHVIAFLAEEYISCIAYDGEDYPNMALAADLPNVPWLYLAKSSELNASGALKLVHTVNDPWDYTNNEAQINASPHTLGTLWGCQCTEPPKPSDCSYWLEKSGGNFYRAMLRCRMRNTEHEFCRACNDVIGQALA
jgi:hypothetical protein